MLFNSYVFLFAFLPVVLVGFYAAAGLGHSFMRSWLALASILFYGFWNVGLLPLLIGSIAFNYVAGRIIGAGRMRAPLWRIPALAVAVGCNLSLLGYYKYSVFLQNTLDQLMGLPGMAQAVSIPLGISFFTFTQIVYLVDVSRNGDVERDPIRYALFVNFFPHLIAGPILHHRDTIPQFSFPSDRQLRIQDVAIGMTIFAFGLFKKVVLADGVQPFVALAFSDQKVPNLSDAWTGVLAYTLQIYFDFSGYSDMAIGLARMFGVKFPMNFNSPYQATNIIDFWRCWHMTLSKFLRDYLYLPLGGNRFGFGQYPNILITMLIGGLWHGAGWTFVIWGLLHGFYLVINHAWQRWRPAVPFVRSGRRTWASRGLTLMAVIVAWVIFRADTLNQAWTIILSMVGVHGGGSIRRACAADPASCLMRIPIAWYWIAGLFTIALYAPNTQQIMACWKPTLDGAVPKRAPLQFVPKLSWAIAIGILIAISIAGLNEHSQFLYYQF